ncbi:hypothetical protein LWV33_00260 [Brucella intermedia]
MFEQNLKGLRAICEEPGANRFLRIAQFCIGSLRNCCIDERLGQTGLVGDEQLQPGNDAGFAFRADKPLDEGAVDLGSQAAR